MKGLRLSVFEDAGCGVLDRFQERWMKSRQSEVPGFRVSTCMLKFRVQVPFSWC